METNFSLKAYNTFGIEAKAKHFEVLSSMSQLETLKKLPLFNEHRLILGGGSNILLTKDFNGIVLLNDLKGKEMLKATESHVFLKAYAGEIWHDLVLYSIEQNLAGLENLSLIPGRVGASPMQNIGAYGVELKDVFESLEAWNIKHEQVETFDREACRFAYRESIFKQKAKNKYIILSVTFKLSKEAKLNTSYGDIEKTLAENGIVNPSIKNVSDAVIQIRSSKLPNPAEIGNSGSFFKNPVVPVALLEAIKISFPNVPSYLIDEEHVKIPAAWLIEQAGWKGKSYGAYGVHKNQALVLVNYGGAKGEDIKHLAYEIQRDVFTKFGVEINPEVNFI